MIYLSLIITLKRGVVVLWLPVVGHYHLRVLSEGFFLFLVCLLAWARTRTKQANKQEKERTRTRSTRVLSSSEAYIDIVS